MVSILDHLVSKELMVGLWYHLVFPAFHLDLHLVLLLDPSMEELKMAHLRLVVLEP
jgi:hypothetical protein